MTQFDYLADRLSVVESRGRLRSWIPREVSGIELIEPSGKRLLNFGGNDYLGLAAEASEHAPVRGSGASALLSGWTADHQLLSD